MRRKQNLISVFAVALVVYGFTAATGAGTGSQRPMKPASVETKAGDSYRFNINNINMPMNNRGILGEVNIGGSSGGRFEGQVFLFAGGFFLSGKNPDGTVWANGVAAASLVEDYQPGRAISQSGDSPQIYVIDGANDPFGQDWQDWKDAVVLGADFYDGNHDGLYNPIDLNGNGKWDESEDRPDLLGDVTAWCIYTDSKPGSQRRYTEQVARGIDIQQTVFGFRSAGLLGNMLFVRYRIINSGKYAAAYDSVYFGVWADSDLGTALDDLVGCDTTLNAGFTYNNGPDAIYGSNPPCYLVDFFQGPVVYVPGETYTDVNGNGQYDSGVDVPLRTAYKVKGQVLGVDSIPGAKNLGLSSFVNYLQNDPRRRDPNIGAEARNYMLGKTWEGLRPDPCNDAFSRVLVVPCASINPTYWYSGDPVAGYGWVYNTPADQRQMQNTGPFELKAGEPVEIVVAMIAGRGTDALNSVSVAKNIATFSKFIYDRNFSTAPPPPVVKPAIRTTDNTIELIWETADQMNYRSVSPAYDVRFEGYEVTMYNTKDPAPTAGGLENAKIIARYDRADSVDNILVEKANGERTILYQKGIQLDSLTYGTPGVGRIRLVVDTDPFTGAPLIKGRPYFISITGYALNQAAMVPVKPSSRIGDYYLSGEAFIQNTANVPVVLNGGIVPGIDFNNPYRVDEPAVQQGGVTESRVYVDEVRRDLATGHQYKFTFFKDGNSPTYSMYWKLEDATAGAVKLDSQKTYIDSLNYALQLIDGLRVRVTNVDPALKAPTYSASRWYTLSPGVFYTGTDLPGGTVEFNYSNRKSKLKQAEGMKRVEIRFGPTQKAYRYVNGAGVFNQNRYEYAAGMTLAPSDTAGGKPIPPNFGKGYVDVPFQVWVKDDRYGVEQQVNCGFFENRNWGIPNGIWDPGTNVDAGINASREYIIVYDTPYRPDTNVVYTGGLFDGVTRWASGLEGWAKPPQWTSVTLSPEDSARAADKWLAALYVVVIQRAFTDASQSDSLGWKAGETLSIPISYPFTTSDVFTYQASAPGSKPAAAVVKAGFEKVNVFPNPLFAFNPAGSYYNPDGTGNIRPADEPYITFSNLPENVTVKIFSLSGTLLRTLATDDKSRGPSSPFLEWDLKNESGLRVASGMYLAIVSAPGIGEKLLKFAIIMPQKQILNY